MGAQGQASARGRDWPQLYGDMARHLPELAARAPLTLCLSNACVDALCDLEALEQAVARSAPPPARALLNELIDRAARAVGGEMHSKWAQGPAWLRAALRPRDSIGGTGPQAAWALSALGAPALVALAGRNERLLQVFPPKALLALRGCAVRPRSVVPSRGCGSEIFIFEYRAGTQLQGQQITKSDRVIVRFDDPGIERDREFETLSSGLAGHGMALIGGLGSVSRAQIDGELEYLADLVCAWRRAGLRFVHLELGGYTDEAVLDAVLEKAGSIADSLGMNAPEFDDVAPGLPLAPESLRAKAVQTGVARLCLHTDRWAAAITRGAMDQERGALLAGSLLAAARAAHGTPPATLRVPDKAQYSAPPFADCALGNGWNFVAVATPFLEIPAATVGLGDTFAAGCLLGLGAAPRCRAGNMPKEGTPGESGKGQGTK